MNNKNNKLKNKISIFFGEIKRFTKRSLFKLKEKTNTIIDKLLEIINKNKIISLIVAIIIISALIATIAVSIRKNNTKYLAGNLKNLGFSISYNDITYCLGYKEGINNGIYKIIGKNEKKISEDSGYYLNKYGKYIYYLDFSDNSIVKMKTNGKDKEIVIENVDQEMVTLQDGYLYYFSNSYFYRAKVTGENKKRISNKPIENYQIIGNTIYYSYKENGKYTIAKMRTDGENEKVLDSNCGRAFFVKGNDIYYIYESNDVANYKINYELCKMNTNGKNKKEIAKIDGNIDISTINFTKTEVYYLKFNEDDEYEIFKMDLKGKKETKIVDIKGYTTKININDNWLYYPDEDDNGNVQMYRIKTNGKGKRVEICK